MTKHEERAERFALSRHSGVDQVSGYIGRLAAEFAAVEAEARRDDIDCAMAEAAACGCATRIETRIRQEIEALKAKAEEKHGDKA